MKIIGVTYVWQRDKNHGFIVQMDAHELERVAGKQLMDIWKSEPGRVLEVCKNWDDAMACRAACEAAAKLPATLRATADCMEAVAERAKAVAEATRTEETAETPA